MFTIDVVSLFPEVFAPFVGLSIVGRAVEAGRVRVRYHHLLDELEAGERADAAPFGGGAGMVLRLEPIARCLDRLLAEAPETAERRAIVVPSPSGRPLRQSDAQRFASLERLIIVCGHYEGIDDRLAALYPIEEYSLGDFVLTGGEIPALAILDATVRLLAGRVAAGVARLGVILRRGRPARLPQLYTAAGVSRRRGSRSAPLRRPRQNRGVAAGRIPPAHGRAASRPCRGRCAVILYRVVCFHRRLRPASLFI